MSPWFEDKQPSPFDVYSLEGSEPIKLSWTTTSERQFDNFMATLSDEIGVSMNPDRPENVILGSLEDPEADLKYKGMHEAPTEGARMSYMDDDMYPSDIYSEEGARLYGHGGTDVDRDRRMHGLLMSVRGKPEAVVTVYRSVPSGAKGTISKGDWVSPDRQYAEHQGARTLGDDGYKILFLIAPAISYSFPEYPLNLLCKQLNSNTGILCTPSKLSKSDIIDDIFNGPLICIRSLDNNNFNLSIHLSTTSFELLLGLGITSKLTPKLIIKAGLILRASVNILYCDR